MCFHELHIHGALQDLYINCKRGLVPPSNLELENTLDIIIHEMTLNYIIIDALDECTAMEQVLKWISSHITKLYIVITSRYFPVGSTASVAIQMTLDDGDSGTYQDISIFLNREIQHLQCNENVQNGVGEVLRDQSQGQ